MNSIKSISFIALISCSIFSMEKSSKENHKKSEPSLKYNMKQLKRRKSEPSLNHMMDYNELIERLKSSENYNKEVTALNKEYIQEEGLHIMELRKANGELMERLQSSEIYNRELEGRLKWADACCTRMERLQSSESYNEGVTALNEEIERLRKVFNEEKKRINGELSRELEANIDVGESIVELKDAKKLIVELVSNNRELMERLQSSLSYNKEMTTLNKEYIQAIVHIMKLRRANGELIEKLQLLESYNKELECKLEIANEMYAKFQNEEQDKAELKKELQDETNRNKELEIFNNKELIKKLQYSESYNNELMERLQSLEDHNRELKYRLKSSENYNNELENRLKCADEAYTRWLNRDREEFNRKESKFNEDKKIAEETYTKWKKLEEQYKAELEKELQDEKRRNKELNTYNYDLFHRSIKADASNREKDEELERLAKESEILAEELKRLNDLAGNLDNTLIIKTNDGKKEFELKHVGEGFIDKELKIKCLESLYDKNYPVFCKILYRDLKFPKDYESYLREVEENVDPEAEENSIGSVKSLGNFIKNNNLKDEESENSIFSAPEFMNPKAREVDLEVEEDPNLKSAEGGEFDKHEGDQENTREYQDPLLVNKESFMEDKKPEGVIEKIDKPNPDKSEIIDKSTIDSIAFASLVAQPSYLLRFKTIKENLDTIMKNKKN